jgi:hypothetical protein
LARAEWLADRQSELLPVPYFHVVFTVPTPIAEIALHNKAVVYGILFTAAAETLRVIAADPRHLGAEIGLVAVLHTWGQNLHHHPHVHCVVPGGGPSVDRTRWIGCRPGFFLPVKVLSRLYRRLFLTRLQAAFDARLVSIRAKSALAGSACRNVRVCSFAMLHVMAECDYSTVKPDKAPGPTLRSPRNQQRDRSQMRAAPETGGDLDGVGVPQLAQERSAD